MAEYCLVASWIVFS